MKQINLSATPRAETGRTASRLFRKDGQIPAVIYGESGVRALTLNRHAFSMAYRQISGRAALIELAIDGDAETHYAIIQDFQRNPRTDVFVHVDFKEIVRGKDMEAEIPVHTTGTAVGVKTHGGILQVQMHELRVRCRPRNLPETIQVDVSNLNVGDSLHVRDLSAIEGVTFLDNPDLVVAACLSATVEEAPTAEAAAEAAPAAAAS